MATKGQRLLAAGTAVMIAEPAFALAHGGGIGAIVGLAIGAVAYTVADDIEKLSGKELPSLPTSELGKPSLAYRLINGKSTRRQVPVTEATEVNFDSVQQPANDVPLPFATMPQHLAELRRGIVPPGKHVVDTEPLHISQEPQKILVPVGGYKAPSLPKSDFERKDVQLSLDPRFPSPQDMAKIIERGFKPARDKILLMETPQGHATEKISNLHHIGLAGSSGRGKTNTTRLITSQLIACDAKVYMINPNFAPVKHNGNRLEDWRPIAAKLQMPVARNPPEIKALLDYFMRIFKERREREQITPKRGADIFLVLGEWPVIVEEYPEAANVIGRLLRQSRQYGIHIIAEFQDALIATIKGNSGTRENYGTAYFFGGDQTTAKTLLKLPEGARIDNNGLGDKGAVYLKSFSSEATTGRVPFFSNKALYMLLGFSEDPVTDELVNEDEFYEDEDDPEIILAGMPDLREEDVDDLFSSSNDIGRQVETPKTLVPIIPDKGRRAEEVPDELAITLWNNGYDSKYKLMGALGTNDNQTYKIMKRIGVAGNKEA